MEEKREWLDSTYTPSSFFFFILIINAPAPSRWYSRAYTITKFLLEIIQFIRLKVKGNDLFRQTNRAHRGQDQSRVGIWPFRRRGSQNSMNDWVPNESKMDHTSMLHWYVEGFKHVRLYECVRLWLIRSLEARNCSTALHLLDRNWHITYDLLWQDIWIL